MIVKIASAAYIAAACVPCKAENWYTPASTVTMQIQSCNLRFHDTFHGSIIHDFESAGYAAKIRRSGSEKSFGFNLTCRAGFNDVNEIAEHFAGRLNPQTKKWVSDFGDASGDEVSQLRPVTKTFPLCSKNGNGFYTIQDDLDGEPFRRMRHITYCLFHEAKAICGDGEVKRLTDAKGDMLPYALSILRSIEFIDSPGVRDEGAKR